MTAICACARAITSGGVLWRLWRRGALALLLSLVVLVPPGTARAGDLMEALAAERRYSMLVDALTATGLDRMLRGDGPFTVLAPTNLAFASLPAGTYEELMKPENRAQLTRLLSHHVLPGRATAAALVSRLRLQTVGGGRLTVSIKDGQLLLGGAPVARADQVADNGVLHRLDRVAQP